MDAYLDAGLDEEDAQLIAERDRIDAPPKDAPSPELSGFLVEVAGPVEEYAERLRAVLGAALDRAVAGLDLDYLDDPDALDIDQAVRQPPKWFAAVCANADVEETAPDFARDGAAHYTAAGHGSNWRLSGWLERFDWDNPFRTWEWWDVTRSGEHTVSIWVDAHGEGVFACDDLRWAAYTAGALAVSGPTLLPKDAWLREPSI